MATIPFRALAERGILHDPSPYQLDLNAWSSGSGIRFHANRASRAQIFRVAYDNLPFVPRHAFAYRPSTGYDSAFIMAPDGHPYRVLNGLLTDVAPAGYVGSTGEASFTSTSLGDVIYLNRSNSVPMYFGPDSDTFAPLPNWPDGCRARSIRAFGDYLIAVNISKGAQSIKTLVKWSDLTLIGQVPGSWDFTDPTTNAGENPLEEVDAPLVDTLPMRTMNVIYAADQVWSMTPVSSNDVFTFRKLFGDGGMIAPNCAVEVAGVHYVFGSTDIYRHDGTTKVSLIDQRNLAYVFRSLDMRRAESCFVSHDPALNEISFCFPSGDSGCYFAHGNGCNRRAIYNIPGDTWSFGDLPNVTGMARLNLDTALSYSAAKAKGLTYANVGGSYYDQESGFSDHIVATSAASGLVTSNRLLAFDYAAKGSLSYPYSDELNPPAFLERTGLDLDQVGSDLVTYKNVNRLFPLISVTGAATVWVEMGGGLTPAGPVKWGPKMPYDPVNDYKVDYKTGGRYLAIRFSVVGSVDFEINGFDLDVTPGGRR